MKFWSWMGGLTYLVLSSGGSFRRCGVRSWYGISDSKWLITFSRAHFLFSAFTTYQGACLISVIANISSLAREYSAQRRRDSRSMGLNFQRLVASFIRS